ncbi:TetR/AcrR family transcriptional regulator [Nocardia sp. NPDC052566]|uniref:TetR/AcrR family transcriptional regulator n=1 Tax=Nocardia sp. NPDC052566 TaxID=3364330 RepID=UPI0037C640C7
MQQIAPMPNEGTRSAQRRAAIVDAATTVFLRKGYPAASMDEVATLAAVSKQTVYKHFRDKETLFVHIIQGLMTSADEAIQSASDALGDSADLPRDLRALARVLLESLRRPRVLQLRRVVIGEAERFPELGRAYWDLAFQRGIDSLAKGFTRLDQRDVLTVPDPELAAQHFAGLVLWGPINHAMFYGVDDPAAAADIDRLADAGVEAFLAAYGRRSG